MTGKHEFQAEVGRLLDIVTNALYTEREIFLRELISNASDACDRLRYESIANPELLEGDGDFKVEVSFDANTRVVEKVEQYLRQNLRSTIRVPEIAAALGLSPNYLSSIYHRLTACTISERVTGLRLEMARELLIRPGSQVKEVAAEVGYHSTRHFALLYRERFGHYPSAR